MFFSVVIPVYNVEKYLNQCVDSILKQTFKDFELILIDDGSSDKCGQICDEYAESDKHVKVIHKENGGLSDARNYGTRIASGQYIIFIDSDDYIASNQFLKKLYEAAEDEPDIILYKYKKYYEDKKKFSEAGFHYPEISVKDKTDKVLTELVKTNSFYCAAWMKSIKRSLLQLNAIEFQKGILSEDQEWYYHVVLCAKSYVAIDEAFIIYRQRAGSITSTTGSKNIADNIRLLQYWESNLMNARVSEEKRYALLSSLGKLYSNLLVAFSILEPESKKKYMEPMEKLAGLLEYSLNIRTQKMRRLYHVFGLKGTLWLLRIARKIKGR